MVKKNKNKRKKTKKVVVFKEIRRNVAGIDLAWRADHYVCGPIQENGEKEITSFGTTTPELYKMLKWLQERNVESVALESTSVYWIPTAELLEANDIEVVLIDPREVRMVPGRKSDMKDCEWIQKLHSCGLLRGAFRPPESVVAIRSILREKETVLAMRVQTLQQMQKSLDQMNIRVHHAVSDIDGVTGTAIVRAIVEGERDPIKLAAHRDKRCKKSLSEIAEHLTGTWRDEHIFNLTQAFNRLQFLNKSIEEYDSRAKEMFAALSTTITDSDNPTSSSSDLPIEKPTNSTSPTSTPAKLPAQKPTAKELKNITEKKSLYKIMGFDLTSLAGIGYETAAIIVAELGNNLNRFEDENKFASYLGLSPSHGKSGGKNVRQNRRCKNTSRAGRALRMAAASLYHSTSALGAYFRNVTRRSDRKTAVKATARRLAHMIYRGVVYGKQYLDCGAEAYDNFLREKMVKNVKKIITTFNISMLEICPDIK
ncbi:MAG: IS110 family transposase [Candidatus Cloacimonetes bacterium]|nr:IS110 family transposase [Candidatus Cloacimonadota bacterium]